MPVNKAEIKAAIASIKERERTGHFDMARILAVRYKYDLPPKMKGIEAAVIVSTFMLEDEGIATKRFMEEGDVLRRGSGHYDCKTTCCIAGDVVVRHGDEYDKQRRGNELYDDWHTFARQKLSIDADTATSLFNMNCKIATAADAIARLEWIYKHGDLDGYDWNSESYCKK